MYIQAIWPIFILYQHCHVVCPFLIIFWGGGLLFSHCSVLQYQIFTCFLFWFCWLSSTSSSSFLPTFLSCVLFFLLTNKCSSSLATVLSSILLLFLAHRFSSPLPTSIWSVLFFPLTYTLPSCSPPTPFLSLFYFFHSFHARKRSNLIHSGSYAACFFQFTHQIYPSCRLVLWSKSGNMSHFI